VSGDDERAEALLALAMRLACEIRDDVAAAHRQVAYMDRADLEALCCVLAACVPVDKPVLPWWHGRPVDTPDVIEERRRVLNESLSPSRKERVAR
jgi:hypothetical protein